jgi:hypothetical protein
MRRAVPLSPGPATPAREVCLPGTLILARMVVSALAACFLFGVGDIAQAASGPWDEEDEADVLGDPDPRNRSGPRPAAEPPGTGTRGHVINLPGPAVPDPIRPFPTRGAGGVGRNTRQPERLSANREARRLPGADPQSHAVSGPPSNAFDWDMARTIEAPLEAVVIPGHPNFTQLTTGPPLAAGLRSLPAVAPQAGRRPRLVADSARTP